MQNVLWALVRRRSQNQLPAGPLQSRRQQPGYAPMKPQALQRSVEIEWCCCSLQKLWLVKAKPQPRLVHPPAHAQWVPNLLSAPRQAARTRCRLMLQAQYMRLDRDKDLDARLPPREREQGC